MTLNFKKEHKIKYILFGLAFLMSGCVGQALQYNQETKIKPNQGIIIIGTHTDWDNTNLDLTLSVSEIDSSIVNSQIVFTDEDDLKIYVLDEGRYEINRIYMDLSEHSIFFNKPWLFEVKKGKALYLGDFTINMAWERGPVLSKFLLEGKFNEQVKIMKSRNNPIFKKFKVEKELIEVPKILSLQHQGPKPPLLLFLNK